MKKSMLYTLWAGLFIICAGLGFIPNPTGAGRVLMTLLSVAFFAPPAVLLYRANREKDIRTLELLRNFSALSLLLTMILLIVNLLSAFRSEWLGNVVHGVLIMVSSPMVCSGYWALSLFLWACLLVVSVELQKKKR